MKSLLSLLFVLWGTAGFAQPVSPERELADYFRSTLRKVDAVALAEPAAEAPGAFPIQDINFDVSPAVSFGVPGMLQLAVAPEMDFVLVPETGTP